MAAVEDMVETWPETEGDAAVEEDDGDEGTPNPNPNHDGDESGRQQGSERQRRRLHWT